MMRIDLPMLARLAACADHRDAFDAAFPGGLDVTGEPDADAIARIVGTRLDVDWLCGRVLTAPACAAYDEATAPALATYRQAIAAALAAHDEATATAGAGYNATSLAAIAALAACCEATAFASAAYNAATAPAAWRLLADNDNINPEYR